MAQELYKYGLTKCPIVPKASSLGIASEKPWYLFRPYRDISEEMSQTATFATPIASHPEIETASETGYLSHFIISKTALGKAIQVLKWKLHLLVDIRTTQAVAKLKMNHPTAERRTHSKTRGNGREAQTGSYCGISNPFAPDINAHPAQPMASYDPHMPAASNPSAHPNYPTHECLGHGFNLNVPIRANCREQPSITTFQVVIHAHHLRLRVQHKIQIYPACITTTFPANTGEVRPTHMMPSIVEDLGTRRRKRITLGLLQVSVTDTHLAQAAMMLRMVDDEISE